jgi:hypothetical protein
MPRRSRSLYGPPIFLLEIGENPVPGVLFSVLLCVLACCFVGLRLLSLAMRTRKLPELCMGLGLLAFAFAQVSRLALGGLQAHISPELALGVYLLMHLGYWGAQLGLCLFTMSVFGPRSRWRWALVLGLVAFGALSRSMMTRGVAPQLLSGAPVPAVPGWDTGSVVSFAMTFGWMAVESLRYHGLLRRRQALGLADPVLTNRFLVWGAGAAATSLLVLLLAGLYLRGVTLMSGSLVASALVTTSGLVNAVVPYLAFTPPIAYLRFVRVRAERGAVDHGSCDKTMAV